MSVASPKTRDELKQYILSKLGHPVLQINVADEQMDIAINDAFQYWNERSHFYGTEQVYLTFPADTAFVEHFSSFEHNLTEQGPGPEVSAPGMVEELEIVSPGSKYPYNPEPAQPTTATDAVELDTDPLGNDITTDAGVQIIVDTVGGSGKNLTVWYGTERTELMGLVKVQPFNAGIGYEVGDIITVLGTDGGVQAVATVTKIKQSSKVFGVSDVRKQNNFVTMPDDVVGITRIFHRGGIGGGDGMIGGIIPGAALGPMFWVDCSAARMSVLILDTILSVMSPCVSIWLHLTSFSSLPSSIISIREHISFILMRIVLVEEVEAISALRLWSSPTPTSSPMYSMISGSKSTQ